MTFFDRKLKLLAAIVISVFASAAQANTIQSVQVGPAAGAPGGPAADRVPLGTPAELTIVFAVPAEKVSCGLSIEWGDGEKQPLRVGNDQQLSAPFKVPHSYKSPGTYRVSIKGEIIFRGLRTTAACAGGYSGTIVVVDPSAGPAGSQAAAPVPAAGKSESTLPAAGAVLRDCPECPDIVVIPAGRFRMGSPDSEPGRAPVEGPVKNVQIAQPLGVGKYEVTRGQFARFVQETGYATPGGCFAWSAAQSGFFPDASKSWRNPGYPQTDNDPVTCVNWRDAHAYAEWLTRKTGNAYRLLSEAEWEYAARAGSNAARPWGDNPLDTCRHANVADAALRSVPGLRGFTFHACNDGRVNSAPAGGYSANAFGLHDMFGNASEWTEDCWNRNLLGPADGSPTTSGDCRMRMTRGGGWDSDPSSVRSASRSPSQAEDRNGATGFRVARTILSAAALRDCNGCQILVSPVYSQVVMLAYPAGFRIAAENDNGAQAIQEAVPAGETVEKWTQMITLTGAKGLAGNANVTPQRLLEQIAASFQGACPFTYAARALGPMKVSGHDGFAALVGCGAVQSGTARSEVAVMLAVKGANDYYTIQWAERGAPLARAPELDEKKWQARLKQLDPIKLCARVPGEQAPYASCFNQKD